MADFFTQFDVVTDFPSLFQRITRRGDISQSSIRLLRQSGVFKGNAQAKLQFLSIVQAHYERGMEPIMAALFGNSYQTILNDGVQLVRTLFALRDVFSSSSEEMYEFLPTSQ